MKSFSVPESRVRPAVQILRNVAARSAAALLQESNRQEIERAVDNVKRTKLDRWFRRQWHKAEAKGRRQTSRRFACFQANHRLSGEQRRVAICRECQEMS